MSKSAVRRIYITGASGSGTTTLGRALGERLGCPHYDTDRYYWLPSYPPFRDERPVEQRLAMLDRDLSRTDAWVLSGGVDAWGNPLIPRIDLVVFLDAPTALRLARLRQRERRMFGSDMIGPGGVMHEEHEAFVEWAADYDEGTREGRNRPRHEAWLAALPCPVLRLDGAQPVDELVVGVLETLAIPASSGRPI